MPENCPALTWPALGTRKPGIEQIRHPVGRRSWGSLGRTGHRMTDSAFRYPPGRKYALPVAGRQ